MRAGGLVQCQGKEFLPVLCWIEGEGLGLLRLSLELSLCLFSLSFCFAYHLYFVFTLYHRPRVTSCLFPCH
jgi:hypothetical protein